MPLMHVSCAHRPGGIEKWAGERAGFFGPTRTRGCITMPNESPRRPSPTGRGVSGRRRDREGKLGDKKTVTAWRG